MKKLVLCMAWKNNIKTINKYSACRGKLYITFLEYKEKRITLFLSF